MQQLDQIALLKRMPGRIRSALDLLLEAVEYAEETSGKGWEFAVEIEQLIAKGLNPNDFRWLVRNSLVLHQREVTLEGDDGRSFRPSGDLTFTDRTCFVLSETGICFARGLCKVTMSPEEVISHHDDQARDGNADFSLNGDSEPVNGRSLDKTTVPKWDCVRRILSVDGLCVKRFKWAAENQEAVLSVFEEESWPSRIDDPLRPQPEQDPKRRLSDTIKCLNRKQEHPIIHFRGDGTGEGVVWEFVDSHERDDVARRRHE